jgi:hypothetical protein
VIATGYRRLGRKKLGNGKLLTLKETLKNATRTSRPVHIIPVLVRDALLGGFYG